MPTYTPEQLEFEKAITPEPRTIIDRFINALSDFSPTHRRAMEYFRTHPQQGLPGDLKAEYGRKLMAMIFAARGIQNGTPGILALFAAHHFDASAIFRYIDDAHAMRSDLDNRNLNDAIQNLALHANKAHAAAKLPADPATPAGEAKAADAKPAGKRRGRSRKDRKPTTKQLEAIAAVAGNNGNIAKAARQLGKDRKTVAQLHEAGLKNAGMRKTSKPRTESFNLDRRGQPTVAGADDGSAGSTYKDTVSRDRRGS